MPDSSSNSLATYIRSGWHRRKKSGSDGQRSVIKFSVLRLCGTHLIRAVNSVL